MESVHVVPEVPDPVVAGAPAPPDREDWEAVPVVFSPDRARYDFTIGGRADLNKQQISALDRLIEWCPGPWASGEPLPPDARVWCALCEDEVVGYMAFRTRKSQDEGWIWDDEMGCPIFVVLRVAVLPSWRRNGIGRRLVEMAEAAYAAFDPELCPGAEPTIRSVTRVPRDCVAGRLFFGSLGFAAVNRWFPGPYSMERSRTFTVPSYD